MLAVESDLRAEVDGLRLRIDGRGQVLTFRLDGGPATVLGLARRARPLLPVLRTLIPVLVRTGLRMDIMVGNLRIAQVGNGVVQNALGRFLRLPAARLGR